MEIVVVYHKHTKKLVPFTYKDNGEIEILSNSKHNLSDLIVSRVDSKRLNLLDGYLLPEGEEYVEEVVRESN